MTTYRAPDDANDLETRAWHRLDKVWDPELRRPVTELGMIESITQHEDQLSVVVRLTVAGCPLRGTITDDVEQALAPLSEISSVDVQMVVMTPEQRAELKENLTSGRPANPFGPGSLTQVYTVASGKGGVGKSSVTANLAAGLAQHGYAVGVVDADIHGFSIPGLFGTEDKPVQVEEMIVPPVAHGVKIISIGMFLQTNQPVVWRGPMLHRALEQFVTDVYWGDLDILLVDLPPGTGDIAISASQLLPEAELLVVTTPQQAAADVAARAGELTNQTGQTVAGVIENMSAMTLEDGTVLDVFGSGGGQHVADQLSSTLNTSVPLLGSVPLDPRLRSDGDKGTPHVITHPNSPGALALGDIIEALGKRPRGLSGKKLPFSPH